MSEELLRQQLADAQREEYVLNGEMDRARAAEELLNNALLQEALSNMETTILERWKAPATTDAAMRDTEGREKLWAMMQGLQGFKAQLRLALEGGRVAQVQVEQTRTLIQRMMDRLRSSK